MEEKTIKLRVPYYMVKFDLLDGVGEKISPTLTDEESELDFNDRIGCCRRFKFSFNCELLGRDDKISNSLIKSVEFPKFDNEVFCYDIVNMCYFCVEVLSPIESNKRMTKSLDVVWFDINNWLEYIV